MSRAIYQQAACKDLFGPRMGDAVFEECKRRGMKPGLFLLQCVRWMSEDGVDSDEARAVADALSPYLRVPGVPAADIC